ncbi:MAG: hypothetical protein UFG06_14035 [Lachnospiraceae bacterium]|nr:hypothetical protein [Lachnospiraceae bacterium]
MTWKEIKIATLQKMQSADKNGYPTDNSADDYIAAMPQAANEALQLLSTANRFIIKPIHIVYSPMENLLSDDMLGKIYTYMLPASYCAIGAKSYYIEICGKGTMSITVGDNVSEIVIDSKEKFTAYKGCIDNTENETVELKVVSNYTIHVRNAALYSASFETDADVVPYSEKVKFDLNVLADDFYMVDNGEVFCESDCHKKFMDYGLESGHIFTLDRDSAGDYTVYYKAYPKKITEQTEESYELPLANEVVALLPLYMASQIYKDDDIGIATTYRNEFEVARELLNNPLNVYGDEHVESESGWI